MPPMRNQGPVRKPKDTKAALKRLFGYVKEDRVKIGFSFLCVVLSSASTLAG